MAEKLAYWNILGNQVVKIVCCNSRRGCGTGAWQDIGAKSKEVGWFEIALGNRNRMVTKKEDMN